MDISVVPPSSSFPPSHISRLPSELLTNIFLRLAHACRHEARAMDCYSHQPYAWLPVTRVCRFWHDAALQCHSLWAFIDVSYDALEWLKVLLVRSGRVPLVAKLNDWDPPYEDQSDQVILELVLQELPRIVKLEVEITASLLTKLEALVQHPPPMLRSLSLRKICINGDDPLHEQGHFPLNFDLPHLRSLKVFRFKFSEAKTLFRPSLRKLVLDATEYPPLREVSECIRELPLLSSLDLLAFDSYDSDAKYPKDYEPVALNHLRWLHIDGSHHYARFLDNLEVAPGASVFFEMATVGLLSGVEADDIDMMTYRAVMFCGLPNYDLKLPPSRMLRSMVVQVNPADEGVIIEIRGWDVVFPHDEFALAIGRPHSLPRPFLHLNLASAFMHNDVEGLMHTTRHFDFQELQTLLFVFNSESRVYNRIGHELADIFDTDSIETLIVPDWHTGELAALITTGDCDVSIHSPDDPSPSEFTPMPFPRLNTLVTYRLRWGDDDEGISPSPLPLSTALKYRAKHNVGIETICLRGCVSDVNREDLEEAMAVMKE